MYFLKFKENYSPRPSSKEVYVASQLFRSARLTNPAVQCRGAEINFNYKTNILASFKGNEKSYK